MKYFLFLCLAFFICSCGSNTDYNQQIALQEYGQYIRDSIQAAQNTQTNEENNETQMTVTTPNKINKKKKSDWRKDIVFTYNARYRDFKRDRISIRLSNNSQTQNYAYIQIEVDFINSSGYVFAQREKTYNIALLTQTSQDINFDTEFPKGTKEVNVKIKNAREYNFN